ncbi:tRNA (adenosine(37)-N6)-threonylcarbamoyltransferase complex ATPase subunit type 1 TsaE [Dactylosporangium siamense]|uniref:tRNA threonylcarbamoyladenosine biosynthesis protein TsaE n=1 Tax=Dactylosporangium siamense TaxID=685454 RepID=A0A919U9G5_9ACTN|nr:tRNA (adenosine(37)-N6)-threonylcarbamoyltransferase complex ATPase subunit type 1 TsaE [Dactylosporangium siamense]GIG43256.1 tRNA (adenosine(37)-N6)-threonylcarbamoyltransferase complex ATPase subunit type 1 TsaE [Dactylosporangium siamense]
MTRLISTLPAVADTHAFGRRLATVLRAGDLVLLTGPLGAGKTALAQGIGAGLRVQGAVTSPTFVIARVHRPASDGGVAMVHVDAYRLGDVKDPLGEIDGLDLDATLEESVTVVEWGEGLVEQLTDDHLELRLTRHDDDSRTVTAVPHGQGWPDRLRGLQDLPDVD